MRAPSNSSRSTLPFGKSSFVPFSKVRNANPPSLPLLRFGDSDSIGPRQL